MAERPMISVRLDPALLARLEAQARADRVTVTDTVTRALEAYLGDTGDAVRELDGARVETERLRGALAEVRRLTDELAAKPAKRRRPA